MSTIYTNKDVYARNSAATTNKNGDEYLCVGRTDGSQTERTFLGFDLSSLTGKIIDTCTLNLYQVKSDYAEPDNLAFYVERITSSWGETTLTWNAQPSVSTTARETENLSGNADGWRSFNITGLIQDIIHNNRSFYGFRLMSTNEGIAGNEKRFRSREYNSTLDPYLSVTYHDMNLWVYNGGWKRAKEVHVYNGGWRQAKPGSSVYANGAWRSFM